MPWEKGKATPGAGRKGFEYETRHKERMIKILDRCLTILEKVLAGKATEADYKKLEVLKPLLMKILDKLHASKSEEKREYDVGDNLFYLIYGSPSNREQYNQLPSGHEE